MRRAIAVFLNGDAIPSPNERGDRITDDSFYLMFNAHHEPMEFRLPEKKWGAAWVQVLNTHDASDCAEKRNPRLHYAGDGVEVQAWSLVLLRRRS